MIRRATVFLGAILILCGQGLIPGASNRPKEKAVTLEIEGMV